MKSPGERGPDGLWLYETRKRRGYTNAEAARAAIEHATGVHIAESVYAQYEAGTRAISPRHRPVLVSFWGEPPAQPVPPASDMAALLATIARLVEALERSEATNRAILLALVESASVPKADNPTGSADPSGTASPGRAR